ncbi:MAG TPA: hypothetical protein PLJ35_13025 [Anaerolineae bacterium]|nr:hypothetical protein [Anaerolineae bacterium]HOQ99736.1 hypothetical protein [Anaerolineae bacterium]HPL28168.1 hypothetical protein [Anaerolineae bacterium]
MSEGTVPSSHMDSASAGGALHGFPVALARRGLQAPALFLLDVAQPFRLLIQQALLVAHPLLSPWAGERLLHWADALQDDEALEAARQELES